MLPKELLRYKIEDEYISPKYITRKQGDMYINIARNLIQIYDDHIGKIRQELDDTLLKYEGSKLNYKILRGFSNILDKNFDIKSAQDIDYAQYRDQFFSIVEKYRPIVRHKDLLHENTRELILPKMNVPLDSKNISRSLYGDLKANQVLNGWKNKLDPVNLIRRYNLQLAQGILYRAKSMRISVFDNYKTIFKYLKLARLMHTITQIDSGYDIFINGPTSLFSHTMKYGINLALFLPALIFSNKWEMRANIFIDKKNKLFCLNNNSGLHTYYKSENPFDSTVEAMFYKKFSKKYPDWKIERETEIINLGESVLIPDFSIYSPQSKKFLLEVVGFWTPEYLQKKIDKLNQANKKNMLIVVSWLLNCSRDDFKGEVIFYKNRINVENVVDKLIALN